MIPVYEPELSGNEEKYVLDAFRSGWISSRGPYVQKFERDFADFIGSSNPGIAVSNGTVALHLALVASGIGPGDEVLVPNFTYVACANAVMYVGATPVFFGSHASDLQPSLESAEKLITKKTRAIVLPHLYGGAADIKGFHKFALELGITLIEDCAEAIGTKVEGSHVGGWGDIATFSFFGNKTLTTGEGGMVIAKNPIEDALIRKIKNQGVSKPGGYHHDLIGFNYRMTNLQAAIGVAQIERADEIISKKQANHKIYIENLKEARGWKLLESNQGQSSYWMETILFDHEVNIPEIIEKFYAVGIETRPGFSNMVLLPMYAGAKFDSTSDMNLPKKVLNLPSSPKLTREQIKFVSRESLKICNQK